MQRIFTQDSGRWKAGEVRDWPLATWKMFSDWQAISRPVDEVLAESTASTKVKKGRSDGT